MESLIGRKAERKILKKALESNEGEMVAVVGRRRVGKTFLIESVYKEHIIFHLSGAQKAPFEEQLANFVDKIGGLSEDEYPKTWNQAFHRLRDYLKPMMSEEEKKVIFFDELPWLAETGDEAAFIRALGYFWNDWAWRQNLVIVICGSATSWIVQKIVFDTGGLHNRITRYIELKPFNLRETEQYLKSKYLPFNRYQIVELYMALGGIPHYLKELEGGKSAIQNIDDICFAPTGLLRTEFSKLYAALFRSADRHIAVIRTLASKPQGVQASEILPLAQKMEKEVDKTTLEELEQSGFITSYFPFGKDKNNKFFRLTDEYSLFYLHFMEDKTNEGEGTWQYLSQTQTYKSWSGYAFESVCMKHLKQIKKALGIAGVYSKSSTFTKKGTKTEKGTQIDLVIDRNDKVINLVEVKFHNREFSLTKAYADKLQRKKWVFEEVTETNKLTMLTMLTTFGLKQNEHSLGLIQGVVTLDDLFE